MRSATISCIKQAVLLGSLLVFTAAAQAEVIFQVDTPDDAPDAVPGDGVCAIGAEPEACSLRAAIMEANATTLQVDDRVDIVLAPGVNYAITIPPAIAPQLDEASGDFDIRRPVDLGTPDDTSPRATIDANALDRAFSLTFLAGGSTLHGLRIVDSLGFDTQAAALYSQAPNLTLRLLDVDANRYAGAGVGCAVRSSGANLRVLQTAIHDNGSAQKNVSGLCVAATSASATVERSSLYRNAGFGLDVRTGAAVSLVASTVSENLATALFVKNASLDMMFSTVVGAPQKDLLAFSVDDGNSGALTVFGSLLRDQSAMTPCSAQIEGNGTVETAWNLVSAGCLLDPDDETSQAGLALLLSPLGDWGGPTLSHLPLPGSAAIDHAPAGICFDAVSDQRGFDRPVGYFAPQDPRCDIGAVEVETPTTIFSDGFED